MTTVLATWHPIVYAKPVEFNYFTEKASMDIQAEHAAKIGDLIEGMTPAEAEQVQRMYYWSFDMAPSDRDAAKTVLEILENYGRTASSPDHRGIFCRRLMGIDCANPWPRDVV